LIYTPLRLIYILTYPKKKKKKLPEIESNNIHAVQYIHVSFNLSNMHNYHHEAIFKSIIQSSDAIRI
jgi:hypothetical protein